MICILHNMKLGSIGASNSDDPTTIVPIYVGTNYVADDVYEKIAPSLAPFLKNFHRDNSGDKMPSIQVFKGKVKTKEKNKDGKEVEKDVEKYLDIDDLDGNDLDVAVANITNPVSLKAIKATAIKADVRAKIDQRLAEINKEFDERMKANQQ